jgi:hypothetical protein
LFLRINLIAHSGDSLSNKPLRKFGGKSGHDKKISTIFGLSGLRASTASMHARLNDVCHERVATTIVAPTDANPCCKQCQNRSIRYSRTVTLSAALIPLASNSASICGIRAGTHDEIRAHNFSKEVPAAAKFPRPGGGSATDDVTPKSDRAVGQETPSSWSRAAFVFNRLIVSPIQDAGSLRCESLMLMQES